MEGIIVNFRSSRHRQSEDNMIIIVHGSDSRDKAAKLVGKTVVWVTPSGKEIKGKIVIAHGNKGAVRAIFERGMPGQAIGSKVKIQ